MRCTPEQMLGVMFWASVLITVFFLGGFTGQYLERSRIAQQLFPGDSSAEQKLELITTWRKVQNAP